MLPGGRCPQAAQNINIRLMHMSASCANQEPFSTQTRTANGVSHSLYYGLGKRLIITQMGNTYPVQTISHTLTMRIDHSLG